MKIALVIYNLEQGGAERVVSLLSREFSKFHEVDILTFNEKTAYPIGGDHKSLSVPSKPGKLQKLLNVFRRRAALLRLFQQERYDKIYAFMESAYLPALLTGYPVVASVRNNPAYYTNFITRHLLPKAVSVVAVSEAIASMLRRDYKIHSVVSIPNPLDFEEVDRKSQEYVEVPAEGYIMAVGRLHDQKGFDLLIRAYSLSQWCGKRKLLIFGEGNMRDDLQRQITELKLDAWIELRGRVENIFPFYAKTDLFVLSSRYEGYPNVLIEALACGAPVIAADCPTGPAEIIRHQVNGLLFQSESISAMVKAMDKCHSDEQLRKHLSDNARKSVEHLRIENIAKKWLEIE